MKETIIRMLERYREKLEKAESKPHPDHATALRCLGAIEALEMLIIYHNEILDTEKEDE